MAKQTLWELAQEWTHEYEPVTNFIEGKVSRGVAHLPACHRCRLEAWAREMDKNWRAVGICNTCGGPSDIAKNYLGVPEDQRGR
ncbi:MAG: hypothetical protein KGL39_14115 [Patescibacteria group bacterium]|nr:hypothetical protein [Patescibacteria group bacterium]